MTGIKRASAVLVICAAKAAAAASPAWPDSDDPNVQLLLSNTRTDQTWAQIGPPTAPQADSPVPSGSAAYTGPLPSYLLGQSQFRAEIFTGFRYDSDANQAIDTLLPGQVSTTVTSSSLRKQPDWSFVTEASINHQYSFQHLHNTIWETNADVSEQRFFSISPNYNLTLAQADTGPRVAIAQIGPATLSLRPFGSFVWIGYEGNTFSTLYGGGLSADLHTARWSSSLSGIGRFGNYVDSTFRPLTRSYTGPEWLLSLSTTFVIAASTQLTAAFSWYQASSRSMDLDRHGPAASIVASKTFPLLHHTADLALKGSVQPLHYDGPPLQVQSTTNRNDTQWVADASLGIALFSAASRSLLHGTRLVFEYQYLRNASNYFPFVDHSFTVGLKLTL
jgi:hypothetical protein